MTNPEGAPIWYELMTTDADAAATFYAEVVGWSIAAADMGGGIDYRLLAAPDGKAIGGLTALPPGAPMPPGWLIYLGVGDVDATVEKIKAHGGSVQMAPQDIPGVGRFAFVSDPQGMSFYIMRGDSPDDSTAFDYQAVGHASWNELVTPDHKAALDFYGPLFGWESTEAMPMGPLGDYAFTDHAGSRIGAMMTAGGGYPARWSFYFRVPSVTAAAARAARAGGTVNHGPQEVPGGDHIIMGTDPQGAAFALVGAL